MEPELIATLAGIYLFGAMVQGLVGFGFAVITVPLVALIFSPGVAVGMNAVVGFTNTAYNTWFLRREVRIAEVARFCVAAVVFVPAGVVGISILDRATAMTLIGTFVVVVSVLNAIGQERMRALTTRPVSFWAFAAASGFFSGAFTSPGPAAVPYFTAREPDAMRAKANLQLFFVLTAPVAAILHAFAGNVTGPRLLQAAGFVPIVLLGSWIGNVSARRVSADRLRILMNIALLLLGAWLVYDNGVSGR